MPIQLFSILSVSWFTPRLTGTSPEIIAGLKKGHRTISHCARSGGFFCSSGHLPARLGATTARFGTTLAVIHIMLAALFRTPVADVRAQLANLLDERTIAGDRVGAQTADRRTLDAAGRTVIFACLAAHVRETIAALGRTVVADGDAVLPALVQMIIHGVSPLLD
jgi:hypothetical protein